MEGTSVHSFITNAKYCVKIGLFSQSTCYVPGMKENKHKVQFIGHGQVVNENGDKSMSDYEKNMPLVALHGEILCAFSALPIRN